MTHSTMTFRRYLVLGVITVTASCGDTFLSRGMKSLGPVSLAHPAALIHAIFSPWVAAGIVLIPGAPLGLITTAVQALAGRSLRAHAATAESLGILDPHGMLAEPSQLTMNFASAISSPPCRA